MFATDESRAELVAVRAGRVTRLPLAKAPVGVALSADERHLFVASEFDAEWRDAGVLSVVDAQRALDWDAGAARLLVASHGSRSIEMLPIAALR